MKDERKKKKFGKKIAAIAASALLIFADGSENNAARVAPNENLPKISTEMELNDKHNYNDLINHYPDLRYSAEEVISLDESLAVHVNGEICETMVPQGLAIKDGLILITAYDGIDGYKRELLFYSYKKENRDKLDKEKNHEPHNSVILVIDQNSRKLISTLELPDVNHVGGIAVDDNYAYIAKSSDGEISAISLEKIKKAVQKGMQEGTAESKISYDYNMECGCDASFVSIRNISDDKKQLVVGTWNPFPNSSTIRIFDFGKKKELILNQYFNINSSCNGAAFVNRNGKEYLIVACSIGRLLNSNLFVYEVEEDENGKIVLESKSQSELPPMAEEVTEFETEDGKRKLAISSEAFSKRYEIGRSSIISNGIIISDLDAVLKKEGRERRNGVKIPYDIYKFDDIDTKEKNEDEEKER